MAVWMKRNGLAIFLSAMCLLFIYFGVRNYQHSSQWKQMCDTAAAAELLSMPVDFSQPASIDVPFTQTHDMTCQNLIRIDTAPPYPTFDAAYAAFDGIMGEFEITHQEGKSVYKANFDTGCITADAAHPEAPTNTPAANEHFPAFRFRPPRIGEYRLKLTVTNGAPALAGIPQTLTMRYQLCGIEYMPVAVQNLMAAGWFLIAFVLGVIAIWRFSRPRAAPAAPASEPPAE